MTKYIIRFFEDKDSLVVVDSMAFDNFIDAFEDFRGYCDDYARDAECYYYPRFYEVKEVEKYEVWGDF